MKLSGYTFLLLIIMAVILAMMSFAVQMQYLSSRLLPLIFSGTGLVLVGIALVREVLRTKSTASSKADKGKESKESWRGYIINMSWIVGFVLSIYILGFIISIAIFVLLYMRWLGNRWRIAVMYTIIAPVFIYGLFDAGLQIDLHWGLLPF